MKKTFLNGIINLVVYGKVTVQNIPKSFSELENLQTEL